GHRRDACATRYHLVGQASRLPSDTGETPAPPGIIWWGRRPACHWTRARRLRHRETTPAPPEKSVLHRRTISRRKQRLGAAEGAFPAAAVVLDRPPGRQHGLGDPPA